MVTYPIMNHPVHTATNFDTLHDKVPVFIAEIAPKDLRGALTTINQVNMYTWINLWSTLFNKAITSEAIYILC